MFYTGLASRMNPTDQRLYQEMEGPHSTWDDKDRIIEKKQGLKCIPPEPVCGKFFQSLEV